jgi:hypothetical protein
MLLIEFRCKVDSGSMAPLLLCVPEWSWLDKRGRVLRLDQSGEMLRERPAVFDPS